MTKGSVSRDARLKAFPQRTQTALIELINAAGDVVFEDLMSEVPEGKTGNLKRAISLGAVTTFGKSRVQLRIDVDLDLAPYYYAVLRGVEGGQIVGKEGKTYSDLSRGGSLVFTGPWVTAERAANNFPRRAVRKSLRKITGLTKGHFVIRVAQ